MAKVSRLKLAKVLAQKLDAGIAPEQLSQEFAAYLLETRRSGELDSMMRDIMQYRQDRGVVEVDAVSAHDLTDQTRADIETEVRRVYPAAQTVVIGQTTDPEVVGGVRLELANEQLDLSVRAKLNRFKQMTNNMATAGGAK